MKNRHQMRDSATIPLFGIAQPVSVKIDRTVRIEFDGGTPCNIPRLGYGDGYGSYKIDDQPIYRVNFRIPMSANCAELRTLSRAVRAVADTIGKSGIALDIHGDSQIALKWARMATESGRPVKQKRLEKLEGDFSSAVQELRTEIEGFAKVTATWRGRQASVNLFGH